MKNKMAWNVLDTNITLMIHNTKMPQGSVKQAIARGRVAQAIISGRLKRPTACSRCGETPEPWITRMGSKVPGIEAHHKDYDKPLDVEWICRQCHRGCSNKSKEIALASLVIRNFPEDLRYKVKIKACEAMQNLREYVIDQLGRSVGVSGVRQDATVPKAAGRKPTARRNKVGVHL